MSTEVDSLIEELKQIPKTTPNQEQPITEQNLTEIVLKKAGKLIDSGLLTIDELRESIQQNIDPDEVLAYASLVKATSQAIEILNKIGLENKKIKTALQLKEMDLTRGAKSLPSGNTNFFIATREQVIQKFLTELTPPGKEPETLSLEESTN